MSNGGLSRLPPLGSGRGSGLSLGLPRSKGGALRQSDLSSQTAISDQPLSTTQSLKYDEAVRSTDGDAVGSRIAAIKSGYLDSDPFTSLLGPITPAAPRSPIINIGTYLRCKEIDALVYKFIDRDDTPKQIISLGAGSDARYWRIQSNSKMKERLHHYVELDFVDLTKAKVEKIMRHQDLLSFIASADDDVRISEWHGKTTGAI